MRIHTKICKIVSNNYHYDSRPSSAIKPTIWVKKLSHSRVQYGTVNHEEALEMTWKGFLAVLSASTTLTPFGHTNLETCLKTFPYCFLDLSILYLQPFHNWQCLVLQWSGAFLHIHAWQNRVFINLWRTKIKNVLKNQIDLLGWLSHLGQHLTRQCNKSIFSSRKKYYYMSNMSV